MRTAQSPDAKPASGIEAGARGPRYAGEMIALHWLIALGILGLLAVGFYMVGLPKGLPVKATLINLHKSLGLTVFLLVLLRIVALAAFNRPPLPPMRAWQRAAARITQGLLYVGMIVMPLAGYLGSSFNRFGTRFWGLPLPKWGWEDPHLRELFFGIHKVTAYVLIALIVLHVAGALKHQWIDRDNLLARMLP
ncbi:cytochrome b561 [Paraburkholderia sp. RAU2J]|uniref:cytochrome b n=1 Tax=Paraburkholderia sp. RAU2J TaxID=1938810 RepID=UPI000EB5D000|nr:cytochrome b [Paraburkholderia sp. RAU2J]RKT21847.1 cytochrome b561 [Paraburkholderia sp. RAU2J]